MDNIADLLKACQELYKSEKYEDMLSKLSEEQLKHDNNVELYKLSALALRRLAVRKMHRQDRRKYLRRSIQHFTSALKLSKNDAEIYLERGICKLAQKKYKDALVDIDNALQLNPKFVKAYRVRATGYWALNKRKLAEKDYTTAIRLNPKDPSPYFWRSDMWYASNKPKKAIQDHESGMKQPGAWKDPRRCVWIGDLHYDLGEYDQAFKYYNEALEKDPEIDLFRVDHTDIFVYNELGAFTPAKRRKLFKMCKAIPNLLDDLRIFTLTDYDTSLEPVVHFTKLSVADILVSSDQNRLRFYHASYMNDPEEGKILLQILKDDHILEAFENGDKNEDTNFYLGSFLPASHADELVMWRTYGKGENDSEARGCSIIIGRDFFESDVAIESTADDKAEVSPKTQPGMSDVSQITKQGQDKEEARTKYDTSLRKVIYYDKSKKKLVGPHAQAIQKKLARLKAFFRKLLLYKDPDLKTSKQNRALDNIIYYVITELRYYFKSSDYSYENEERVILFVPPKSHLVKIDERGSLPKRLYVEAKGHLRKHIQKIIIGPRVSQPDRWYYLKVKMIKENWKIKLTKSECKFQ
ncbi:MAG TPA: tetratricopeptide repeat protein [Chryseolinea sp.]